MKKNCQQNSNLQIVLTNMAIAWIIFSVLSDHWNEILKSLISLFRETASPPFIFHSGVDVHWVINWDNAHVRRQKWKPQQRMKVEL